MRRCPVLVEGWTDDGQTAGSWRERKRQRRVASLPWNRGDELRGAGWAWWASDSRPALCFNRPLILAASPTLNFSSQWLKLLTFNNLSHHFDFARSASMGAPTKVAPFKMEVVSCVCFSENSFLMLLSYLWLSPQDQWLLESAAWSMLAFAGHHFISTCLPHSGIIITNY